MTNPTTNQTNSGAMSAENDTESVSPEVAALRAKNTELLGKLRTAKDENERLQADLQSAAQELDEARARVHELQLGGPVRDMVAKLSPVQDFLLPALEKHGLRFDFVTDEDGEQIVLLDKDGNRVRMPTGKNGDLVAVPFEENALWRYFANHCDGKFDQVIRASGSEGAGATDSGRGGSRTPDDGGTPPPAPSPYALR